MKRISIILLLFSLAALTARAGVELKINSDAGVFAKGDTVKVTAVIPQGMGGDYILKAQSYGKDISKERLSLPEGESIVYAKAFEGSISVILNLSPASDAGDKSGIGFIVAPEDFRPGLNTPSDLREYWDRELASMRALKPKVLKSRAVGVKPEDALDIMCYKVEIPMPSGNPCRAYVAYPINAKKGSLPMYVRFHAAGITGAHVPAYARDVVEKAKQGFLAIDVNAHGILDDQPKEYYSALARDGMKDYERRDFTSVEDYYFHNMFLRDIRAIDYAATLPCWDGKRILVRGGSQGGGQAMAVGGIDSRVTHVLAINPALTDMGGALQDRRPGWPASVNRKYAGTELGRSVLAYHDAALLISLFKGDMLVEASNIDTVQDPAAVVAAFNNASAARSKNITFFPWAGHSGPDSGHSALYKSTVKSAQDRFVNDVLHAPAPVHARQPSITARWFISQNTKQESPWVRDHELKDETGKASLTFVGSAPAFGRETSGTINVSNVKQGDYFLITAACGPLPAGADLDLSFSMGINGTGGAKKWICEYYDGKKWKAFGGKAEFTMKCYAETNETWYVNTHTLDKALKSKKLHVRIRATESAPDPKVKVYLSRMPRCSMYLAAWPEGADRTTRVLMIGNSFTFFSATYLAMLEIAHSQGRGLDIGINVKGGQSFSQHLQLERTLAAIAEGGYEAAFLQNNTMTAASYAVDSVKNASIRSETLEMVERVRKYSPSCRVILERTWPWPRHDWEGYGSAEAFLADLEKGSSQLAAAAGVEVSPIANAFVEGYNSGLKLYYGDKFHQNRTGAYLKACVNYLFLFGEPFLEGVSDYGLPPETARTCREIASKIVGLSVCGK